MLSCTHIRNMHPCQHAAEAAYYVGVWTLIGGTLTFLVMIAEIVINSTLLSRVRAAYMQIPVDTDLHQTWSTLDAAAGSNHTLVAPRSPSPPPRPRPKISRLRMAKYLAGVAPLASSAPEKLSQPLPPATTRLILREWLGRVRM